MWHLRSPVNHTFNIKAIVDNKITKIVLIWWIQEWNKILQKAENIIKEKLETKWRGCSEGGRGETTTLKELLETLAFEALFNLEIFPSVQFCRHWLEQNYIYIELLKLFDIWKTQMVISICFGLLFKIGISWVLH